MPYLLSGISNLLLFGVQVISSVTKQESRLIFGLAFSVSANCSVKGRFVFDRYRFRQDFVRVRM
jgi:hypothetical protein